MISIIICSKCQSLLNQVSANIAATIGVEYEIIPIINHLGQYSLSAAYNLGASQSHYPMLCFAHEDVLFHTTNWGERVVNILSDPQIGLIGVAGNTYKTSAPSGWPGAAVTQDHSSWRMHLTQHYADKNKPVHDYNNPKNETLADVVVLDGVWLCCRKNVWQETQFDDETFQEFHFYDLDFSLEVYRKHYRVCVTYEILLEHLSEGTGNDAWFRNSVKFFHKWKDFLPVSATPLEPAVMRQLELDDYKALLPWFMAQGVSRPEKLKRRIANLRQSREYRLGSFFFNPLKTLRRILGNSKNKLIRKNA